MCHVCRAQTLRLDFNQIGVAGVTALAEACAGGAMAHLDDLFLSDNPISEKAKDTMRTAMSNRSGNVHF